MDIYGGNNDIDFYITNFKNDGIPEARVVGRKEVEFVPKSTDNYSFVFSNAFSWRTGKNVIFAYHLENGREPKIKIGL